MFVAGKKVKVQSVNSAAGISVKILRTVSEHRETNATVEEVNKSPWFSLQHRLSTQFTEILVLLRVEDFIFQQSIAVLIGVVKTAHLF